MAPPDGELANSTAQNHVSKSNRDGKTKKKSNRSQSEETATPRFKQPAVPGAYHQSGRARFWHGVPPSSDNLHTILSPKQRKAPPEKYNRLIPRPIKKTQPMPHLLPSIILRPTIQIRNTQQYLINISHPTGQLNNLKITTQNNKTDTYDNNNKPAVVSNNTNPSKQAGSEGEIMTPYTSNTRFNIGREKS